jgi:ferrous iron transport protein B
MPIDGQADAASVLSMADSALYTAKERGRNRIGTIEPLVRPLGFDWKIGIGIVTSLAAREVIVGTLGTLYGMEGDSHSAGLQAALRHDLTPGGAVALLVFFAFAMQCFSTIAVVRRETGGWTWPAVQFTYMGALAWLGAFAANRIVTLLIS